MHNIILGIIFVLMILKRQRMKKLFVCCFVLFMTNICFGQETFSSDEEFERQYKISIKKTHLDGVYIPATLEEAFDELKKLSTEEALNKFKSGPELVVAKKLHFGIGRWMAVNWKFYTGSRLSHLLKEKGIQSPDNMSQYMIRAFHRYLNDVDSDESDLIAELKLAREKEMKPVLEKQELIKEETKPITEKKG